MVDLHSHSLHNGIVKPKNKQFVIFYKYSHSIFYRLFIISLYFVSKCVNKDLSSLLYIASVVIGFGSAGMVCSTFLYFNLENLIIVAFDLDGKIF